MNDRTIVVEPTVGGERKFSSSRSKNGGHGFTNVVFHILPDKPMT